MSTKAPSLQTTKDYSKFELCQFNRSVEKKKFLKQSMLKHGFIAAYPIHCTRGVGSRLKIKAGHHRFEVAQELGIGVYYVISEDEASIHELEKATTRWTMANYLESFAKCGIDSYVKVKEFHERTGISIGLCVSMIGGECASSSNLNEKFKYGEFVARDTEHAEQVYDIVGHCADHGIRSRDVIFVQSVSRCLFVEEFSAEVFKIRAAANASLLKPCRSIVEQTALFETIYNMKARAENKLPLSFLTTKAMASRNAVLKAMESRGNK